MKESTLRKWHGRVGVTLAAFIILQAGSGVLMGFSWESTPHTRAHTEAFVAQHSEDDGESLLHESLEFIHHGAGAAGSVYRIFVGIGTVGMALSGSIIFVKTRARSKRR